MATLHARRIASECDLPLVVVLRKADVEECKAAGLTEHEALQTSVRLSAQSWEVRVDGRILGWWGHAPVSVLGNLGVAWCLSAPGADQHPVVFGRLSYSYTDYLMSLYAEVFIQVDLNYTKARRWLRWLGFEEINRSGRFATMRKVR